MAINNIMNNDMHMLFEAYRGLSEQQQGPGTIGLTGSLGTLSVSPSYKKPSTQGNFFNQVVVTPAGHLDLNENILFDFDKAALKPAGQRVIQQIAQKVLGLNNPNIQVNVVGYTDLYGGTSYNQQLGMSRAQAVSEALQRAGVTKVSAKPGGMKNPKVALQYDIVNGKAPAEGIQQQQPNRRVEIEFNPPLPKQIMQQIITNVPQTPPVGGNRYITSGPQSPEQEKITRDWMQSRGITQ